MDRETLNEKGLLEQYLLGLTTREESLAVEEYLEKDPQARADLEHLRRQLGVYLEDNGIEEKMPPGGQSNYEPTEDEQMLAYLLGRNQRLNIARYVLMALTLMLTVSTFYFDRQSSNAQAALLTEKARHVQDDHIHEAALKKMDRETVHLDSIRPVIHPSKAGNLQLHYLAADSVLLLDLSHLDPPHEGFAYHVHVRKGGEESSRYVVAAGEEHGLYPLERSRAQLRLLYGPTKPGTGPTDSLPVLIDELRLDEAPAWEQ